MGIILDALSRDPQNANTQNNLGAVLMNLGQLDESLKHYDEAIRLNPNHEGYKKNRAQLLEKMQSSS